MTTGIPKARFESSWKSEYQRLFDQVPCEEMQVLTNHTDEVLHVKFSHDGSELVSCSKDRTFMVWTDQTELNDGKFHCCYSNDMLKYEWRHTWAAQFSPNDSKLMVSGGELFSSLYLQFLHIHIRVFFSLTKHITTRTKTYH